MTLTDDRKGRITASRIAGILGLSPYTNRDGVLREMVRQHFGAEQEFRGNFITEYGNEHEDDALGEYEQRRGIMTTPSPTVVHPTFDYLAATPDGLVGDDGLVECKCPWRAKYTHISERPDYEAQIRLQLEVTGRAWCDFVVWTPDGITVSRVEHDPNWLPSVQPILLEFMEQYAAIVADPEAAAPFLEPIKDERDDEEWAEAALEWQEAKWVSDRATEALAKAKQNVLNLTDKPARGAGVQVIRKNGSRRTDWATFAKEHELEPDEKYIKVGSPTWEVRKAAAS